MPRDVFSFELLHDGLVEDIVQRVPSSHRPLEATSGGLAATCRRLCTLVRQTRHVSVAAGPEGVLRLARAPTSRAFSHVTRLELRYADVTSLEQWASYWDAAAAAATTWPELHQVELLEGPGSGFHGAPGCLSGALLALRQAPALRRLLVKLPDQSSLVYVAPLTQLTHLELNSSSGQSLVVPGAAQGRPLADMPNLVSLRLRGRLGLDELPCMFPPNLTRLELHDSCSSFSLSEDWWEHATDHIAGCEQLQELVVEGDLTWEPLHHPSLMLQSIAAQLTGLPRLRLGRETTVSRSRQDNMVEVLQHMLVEEPDVAEMDEEWVEQWMPKPPLFGYPAYANAAAYAVVPPPNMGELIGLQELTLTNWWLVVSSERYWRALGGCSSLRSLSELHASVAPPAGVTFPHLTRLIGTVNTSPGDTVALLGAFPALRELQLTVAPRSSSDPPPPSGQVRLGDLTTAGITLLHPLEVPLDNPGQCLAAYCSALWGALPGVRDLRLRWPPSVQLLPHLPGVAALQQLSALQLGARYERGVLVDPQQVMRVVRGATQLQELGMWLVLHPGNHNPGLTALGLQEATSNKDQLVLDLQEELPGLTWLGVRGAAEPGAAWGAAKGLAPATLAALRPGLKVVVGP